MDELGNGVGTWVDEELEGGGVRGREEGMER